MYALIGMVTVVLVVNIFASVRVLTSGVITRRQKTLQLLFVWLIPVVGALVVAGVHRNSTRFLPAGSFAQPAWCACGSSRRPPAA